MGVRDSHTSLWQVAQKHSVCKTSSLYTLKTGENPSCTQAVYDGHTKKVLAKQDSYGV